MCPERESIGLAAIAWRSAAAKICMFERGTSEFANFSEASLAIVQADRLERLGHKHRYQYVKPFFLCYCHWVWVVTPVF